MNPTIPRRERIAGYLSVAGAAAFSGLSERHINYLVNTHRLRAIRFSGVFAIESGSLDKYLASRTRSGVDGMERES